MITLPDIHTRRWVKGIMFVAIQAFLCQGAVWAGWQSRLDSGDIGRPSAQGFFSAKKAVIVSGADKASFKKDVRTEPDGNGGTIYIYKEDWRTKINGEPVTIKKGTKEYYDKDGKLYRIETPDGLIREYNEDGRLTRTARFVGTGDNKEEKTIAQYTYPTEDTWTVEYFEDYTYDAKTTAGDKITITIRSGTTEKYNIVQDPDYPTDPTKKIDEL